VLTNEARPAQPGGKPKQGDTMDKDVEKALKSIQKDLKDVQDVIDSMKEVINDNATVESRLVDEVKGHTKSIAVITRWEDWIKQIAVVTNKNSDILGDLEKRVEKLEK
jgi:hypothetical protein